MSNEIVKKNTSVKKMCENCISQVIIKVIL